MEISCFEDFLIVQFLYFRIKNSCAVYLLYVIESMGKKNINYELNRSFHLCRLFYMKVIFMTRRYVDGPFPEQKLLDKMMKADGKCHASLLKDAIQLIKG